jgi:hypothetical protein
MRKALLKYAMILMATLSLASLCACGNDDDEDSPSNGLVGIWAYCDEILDGFDECWGYQFNADGTGSEGYWNVDTRQWFAEGDAFTWSTTTSGKIIIDYYQYNDTWIANYILSDDMLYMWEDDEEVRQDKLMRVQ